MNSYIRPAFVLLIVFSVICGILYPLVVTAIGEIAFRHSANGSLIERNGKVIGSALIGQSFAEDRYFHGRPSAAGNDGYDATSSGGSNLGPTSAKLIERVTADVAALGGDKPVPADAVLASASGLDPHISPSNAARQIARVATARGIPEEAVRILVARFTQGRELGILGEPRVDVLGLNLALDDRHP